mmetsp:Transcript_13628/g.39707  ORF Transcript_13628/g.39707 Transcript_13628/m.39707 type:complete len:529 (-) Transcript_13628:25-1611(-)
MLYRSRGRGPSHHLLRPWNSHGRVLCVHLEFILEGGAALDATIELEVRRGMLPKVLDEIVDLPAAIVLHRRSVLGEEEEGREAAHVDIGVVDLVGGGVHLGDHDRVHALELLSELVVLGGEGLAVAAPGSVELDEHVLAGLNHVLLERLARDDLDGGLHVGWLVLLGLEGWGQSALEEVLLELDEALSSQVLALEHVLLHGALSAHVGDDGLGELVSLEAKVGHDPVLRGGHVDVQHLAPVLISDLVQGGKDAVGVGSLLVDKSQRVDLDGAAEDLLGALLRELNHLGSGHRVEELPGLGHLGLGRDGKIVALLIELLEDDKGVLLGILDEVDLTRVEELKVVDGSSEVEEDLGLGGLHVGEEARHHHFVGLLKLLQGGLALEGLGGRPGLLLHELDNVALRAAALVVSRLAAAEELERWEAPNAILLREATLLGSIHHGDPNRRVKLHELASGLFVLGCELLAVAAPGSVELNHDARRVGLESGIEVRLVQDQDSALLLGRLELGTRQREHRKKERRHDLHDSQKRR